MFLLAALVFLSVTLMLVGLFLWLIPSRTQQRVLSLSAAPTKSDWVETAVGLAGPLAKLSAPAGDWESSPLRLKFIQAGIRRADGRLLYFAAKTVLPLLFAGIAYFVLRASSQADALVLLLYLMLAALFGCYLPNLVVHFAGKQRKREIFENFPDATDLLLVCVEAGLGLDAGLVKVTEEMRRKSVALAEELHLTNLEMRAGASREKALRNLALRSGVEEITTFATMLTQADRFGTSIGDSLRAFSDDLRHKRQTRAEEMAAKVPTKMLFPLVVCIFPSIIMVIMGPAVIQIIRTLLPMISKGG